MAKNISVNNLSKELKNILNDYNTEICEKKKKIIHEVSDNFKKNTKKDAPRGKRKKFYKHIDVKKTQDSAFETTDTWYVKDPEYRLTHLIKNGHQTRNGGRTKSNDFIDKNFDIAEKELTKKIEDMIIK